MEKLVVQQLDVSGFEVGTVPTFNQTFAVPGGEPSMGNLSPLYVPSLPKFGPAPAPLSTSNLFQTPTPTFELPEFDGTFPDINTEWDIPVAPVIAYPEAPVIAPLDLTPVELTLPTILDPDTFTEFGDTMRAGASGYAMARAFLADLARRRRRRLRPGLYARADDPRPRHARRGVPGPAGRCGRAGTGTGLSAGKPGDAGRAGPARHQRAVSDAETDV